MGTRSLISMETNGELKAIYCHYDGYKEGVGQTLFEHYQDEQKVRELVSLGDMSVLEKSIECPEGHSFGTQIDGYSVFYGRDRGEVGVEAKTYGAEFLLVNFAHRSGIEYLYKYVVGHGWFMARMPRERFVMATWIELTAESFAEAVK